MNIQIKKKIFFVNITGRYLLMKFSGGSESFPFTFPTFLFDHSGKGKEGKETKIDETFPSCKLLLSWERNLSQNWWNLSQLQPFLSFPNCSLSYLIIYIPPIHASSDIFLQTSGRVYFLFRPFSPSQILLIFQKNVQFLLRSFSFSKMDISFLEPSYFQNNTHFHFLDPSHFSKMYITSLLYPTKMRVLDKNMWPRQKCES